MHFVVDVKSVEQGWDVRVLDRDGQPVLDQQTQQPILPVPRRLERLEVEDEIFPLPPATNEDSMPADMELADVPDAFQNLMNESGSEVRVEQFGRYLFNTLLGPIVWSKIDETAGKEPIELALTWPADDGALNRLPWEIMHTSKEDALRRKGSFLAAGQDVFITRRVADTRKAASRIDRLPSPPRVLFAIGSNLNDPFIRPGAEYLGLLQRLERSRRYLHTHVLVGATTDTLEEEIRRFSPTVVHIICHGVTPDGGKASLEFQSKPGSTDPDYVDAERLERVLRTEHDLPLPRIVVLNACSTGAAEDVTVGRPMAAELVSRGVPIVVGMSGKIADQACRLFTQGFYSALLEGGEIARAAARGRRAAITRGGINPARRVDWALPTLFLAEDVGEARIDIQANDDEAQRLNAAKEFSKRPDYPVFCGRWEFFTLYRELMSGGGQQFMAISVPRRDTTDPANPEPQFGSQRLLKELAAQAMRDGHIPILISKDWLNQQTWPSKLEDFLNLVIRAVNKTIDTLRSITRHEALVEWNWTYMRRFRESYPNDPTLEDLPAEFRRDGLTNVERLAKAFMLDLLDLRLTICQQRGQDENADVKLLVLIDDYHQLLFGDTFLTLLDKSGLNDPRARHRTRGVITYHETPTDGQGTTVMNIKNWANSHDVTAVSLDRLHAPINPEKPMANPDNYWQAALIYRHFLLNWQRGGKKRPLSIAQLDSDRRVSILITELASLADGLPSKLCEAEVSAVISYEMKQDHSILRAADDENLLADLDSGLRQRGT